MRAPRRPPPAGRHAPKAVACSGWEKRSGRKRIGVFIPARPHLPVVTGSVARAAGLDPYQSALVLIYTTMTGSSTAGQRLLALDPGDVALLGVQLTRLCENAATIACAELADLSDPLLDVMAQRHELRPMPLFAS